MSFKDFFKLVPNLSMTLRRYPLSSIKSCSGCLSSRNDPCLRIKRQYSVGISFRNAGSLRKNVENFPFKMKYSVSATTPDTPVSPDSQDNHYMDCSDSETRDILIKDMKVIIDFISEEEEQQLLEEVEPYLKRLKYEDSHWDDAIHGYRETERRIWTEKNKKIIQRIRDTAFPPGIRQLAYVHVLDLQKEGVIKAHVDAVKFCGDTITGLSLLTPAIMRLVHTDDKTKFADILLSRRSLYIMRDAARYNYTHEVLADGSQFKGKTIQKDRRISVMCRNEP